MPYNGKQLSQVVADLKWAADGGLDRQVVKELAKTVRPFAPLIRAEILNIPVKGLKPYKDQPPRPPGLRTLIARCVHVWADYAKGYVTAGIEVDSSKMPDHQKSLPLMMQGAKRWRHPLFGDVDHWVGQESHPYFYKIANALGPASSKALNRALERISAILSA